MLRYSKVTRAKTGRINWKIIRDWSSCICGITFFSCTNAAKYLVMKINMLTFVRLPLSSYKALLIYNSLICGNSEVMVHEIIKGRFRRCSYSLHRCFIKNIRSLSQIFLYCCILAERLSNVISLLFSKSFIGHGPI